ncbi:serine hydrolase [Kitasatospora sp. NE20-6]|uniref:serine hydrolase domain-containing protein n=1 Tax=Kitasatospora sp. NE20-6 TaxID=2859066 RepID=UPI0034DC33BD
MGTIDLAGTARSTAGQVAEQGMGAVVAVLAGGRSEIHGAGRTGADQGPPDSRTVFDIGSVTKVFTALVLARAVGDGHAALDEPLADLLPGTRVPSRGGEQITLQHLATHTSGLPRLPRGMRIPALLRPGKPDPYAHCTPAVLLRGLAATRLGATPGTRFRYSNLGAGLLGLALARRAGTGYADLVADRLTRPLGLDDTGVGLVRPGRTAQGHTPRLRPTVPWDLAGLAGAGGLRSTAVDLTAFLQAHLDPPAGWTADAVRLARAVEHPQNPFARAHLGWFSHRLHAGQGGHLQVWHNGGTGGFASFAGFDPEKRVGAVVLGNTRRSVDREGFGLLRTLQDAYAA